jgi:putative ABC transport system permease protein
MATGARFPRLVLKLRTLFRRDQVDQELDEELRYHVERKTELLIAQGMPPADARYAALRAFGGVELRKEACRDARGPWASIWLERLSQDVRHGVRMLAKNPGFTLIAILSIAIGVGANAAMFSVADGLLLRPLSVPDPGGVVVVGTTTPAGDVRYGGISYPDYLDLRDRVRSFDGLAATRIVLASLTRSRDEIAQGTLGMAVSADFFDVLRVRPALGRTFLPGEEHTSGDDGAVVVLAHGTWRERFGGDPRVVGSQIRISGTSFTVVGVAPEGFGGTSLFLPAAYYVPLATLPAIDAQTPPDFLARRGNGTLDAVGRLEPGASVERASEEVALLARALQQQHPATNDRLGMLVRRETDARQAEARGVMALVTMLIGLAVAVLLVACANVAGLLTSRAPARAREIAVRVAIGGGRVRLMRQLITESLLIAVAGGAAGLALGYAGVRSFQLFQPISHVGVRLTFALDRRALVVGLGAAALSALLSSAIPAWRSTRIRDLSGTLRNATTPSMRASRLWGRHGLVAAQVALTLVLLTVALSFYRAFEAEYGQGPGFRTDHVLLTTLDPGLARHGAAQADRFYQRLRDRAAAIPGVSSVALTSFVPLNQDGGNMEAIVPEGVELPAGAVSLDVTAARVDEGYFEAIGIGVLEGRGLAATDTAETPRVGVVSHGMAARYWPGESALGKRVRVLQPSPQWVEVVGVAADIKFRLFAPSSTPFLYLPRRQYPAGRATLVVRTQGDSLAAAQPVRAAILETDRDVPILGMHSMEVFYDGNARNMNRVIVRTIGTMGAMGLALALIGLYGLTAYTVSRRTREIGVRMAVGGMPGSMLGMILRQGAWPPIVGLALGIAASAAVGRLISSVFPNTGADFVTFGLVVPAVAAVALLAAYVPARRAALIDPLVALRQD